MMPDELLSRRELLKASSFGLAAALSPAAWPATAAATTAATTAGVAAGTASLAHGYWTADYWAPKGELKLYLYRKRLEAPRAGEPPLPVLERETGRSRFHFYGESSGALRAAAFAMASPEREL